MEENQDFKQIGNDDQEDELHIGLKIASFCFPIVGAIFYFVKKDQQPRSAKQACNLALIGFAVGLVLNIIARVAQGM